VLESIRSAVRLGPAPLPHEVGRGRGWGF
jgi:hypothetical protein